MQSMWLLTNGCRSNISAVLMLDNIVLCCLIGLCGCKVNALFKACPCQKAQQGPWRELRHRGTQQVTDITERTGSGKMVFLEKSCGLLFFLYFCPKSLRAAAATDAMMTY